MKVTHMDVSSMMKAQVAKELLCYRAGRAIFCPACERIMDWRRTVEVSIILDGQHIASVATCAACAGDPLADVERYSEAAHKVAQALGVVVGDPRQGELLPGAPRAVSAEVEVIDGRVVAPLVP